MLGMRTAERAEEKVAKSDTYEELGSGPRSAVAQVSLRARRRLVWWADERASSKELGPLSTSECLDPWAP